MNKSQVCWKYRKLQCTMCSKCMIQDSLQKMPINRREEKVRTIAMAEKFSEVWGQMGKPLSDITNGVSENINVCDVYMKVSFQYLCPRTIDIGTLTLPVY